MEKTSVRDYDPPPMDSTGKLPRWPFRFDAEKALEAVLFIIPRLKNPTLHSVSKILYHADREHMSQYARPISGDWYVAMEHGPVPSSTYNILKTLKGVERFELPADAPNALRVADGKKVFALREAHTDRLSRSEIECLLRSAEEHGNKSFGQLAEESHDAAWRAVGDNEQLQLQHFLLTLPNAAELVDHFKHE